MNKKIIMNNWYENKYPFQNFNEALTNLWILNNFSKVTTREWLEAGLQPNDYDLAKWLVEKKISPDNFLENCDYQETKEKHEREKRTATVTLKTIEGPGFKMFDSSSLPVLDLEREKKKIDLYKQLDKGKKLITKIEGIDQIYWGSLRFTIADSYRDWASNDQLINFFTEDVSPYKDWKVGDQIEIDLERLNGEKCSLDQLKEAEQTIIRVIGKGKEKEVKESMGQPKSEKAKLRAKVRELNQKVADLEEKLANEKRLRAELLEAHNSLNKFYGEEIEKKIVFFT